MRIAQVVTYISPDGAFGGPVRVALGQAEALAERGHEVTVYAASPDPEPRTIEQDGYVLRTFPSRRIHPRLGFAGMYAKGLTAALTEQLPRLDVVHVHLARDLVTLPAARAVRKAGVRLVAQPHGMIDKSSNPLAGPVDAWETKASLSAAAAVLTLTEQERRDISGIVPAARVRPIGNGIKVGELPSYEGRTGGVLFLARLHPRKRATAFVEAALELLDRGVDTHFTLAGPDEGEADAVRAMIEGSAFSDCISWIGPVDPARTDELLRGAEVFVLPSFGEVFPMTVLESFRAGTPVVTTSSLGIAAKCEEHGAAIVTDGSAVDIAESILRLLLDAESAQRVRAGAAHYLQEELSMEPVIRVLEQAYSEGATR